MPTQTAQSIGFLRALILGGFVAVSAYHLITIRRQRGYKTSLYLVMGTAILIARVVIERLSVAPVGHSVLPLELIGKLDYLALIGGPTFFAWLTYAIFPLEGSIKILRLFTAAAAACGLCILATPAEAHDRAWMLILLIIVEMCYVLLIGARAIAAKRDDASLFLMCSLLLAMSVVSDAVCTAFPAAATGLSGEFPVYGLVTFLYLYALISARNWARVFHEAQRLSRELTRMQIKPHFLYNTLSMISSLTTREPETAKELLLDLSDYLRGAFRYDNQEGKVQISEEIGLVRVYMRLMQARHKDTFRVLWDIDETIEATIPMLIIQPLVENALGHGLFDMREGGVVGISVKKIARDIVIVVEDNGKGMPKSLVDQILRDPRPPSLAVGLININRRLQLECGRGLAIESEEGRGTRVEIRIPAGEVSNE